MKTTMKHVPLALAALAAFSLGAVAVEAPASAPAGEPNLAIHASHVLVEGDTVLDDALVLIGDGKVLAVGLSKDLADKLPDGLRVVEHEGWLSTGLIAANGTMGLDYTDDSTGAFMEDLVLATAFDSEAKRLVDARELGVTSFALVAGRSNVIGGVGAVVKTSGKIVDDAANLSICIAPPALRGNRFPTSYGGALRALRERLEGGGGALAKASRSGKVPVQIAVNSRAEIARAIDFGKQAGLRTILRGATRAGEFAVELKEAKMMVALPPIVLGGPVQSTDSVLALAEAGVPFAFGLAEYWSPAFLRESAALAERAGLDRATAWNAITKNGARLMGTADHMGRIAPGYDADLVLWTGDPLSITSRPVAVYIDGELSEGDKN
jgi:hypothetical protein